VKIEEGIGGGIQKLKEISTTEPALAILDLDKEMQVEADMPDYTTGGVLLTKYKGSLYL